MRTNRKLALLALILVLAAVLVWWGGGALWRLLLAMHGR